MQDRAMVTFVLSHACPLKCNFCCSTREVVGPGRVTREMLDDCLTRFGRQDTVERFAFTGGDPFLFIDDITAAVGAARRSGIAQPFQIVTSAYWAKTREQVHDVLSNLRALGMDLIGLSYDHEHARWVSPEQIRLVCDAAAALSLKVNLTGVFWEQADRVESLVPDIVERHPFIRITNLPVAPIGDARTRAVWTKRAEIPIESKLSCGQPGFYSLSIYPDGEVYPCCSGGFQIEGRLSCGNVHTDSPARILYAAATNFHVRLVKEFGWGLLYEIVEREAPELLPELPSLKEAGGVCEICRDLNLRLAGKLAPVYHTIEIEYARTRAEFEWRTVASTSDSTGRLWFDDRLQTLPEVLESLTARRDIRLDYLAGVLQFGAIKPGSHYPSPDETRQTRGIAAQLSCR
jgi:MoaA/NifB/PqqE/SkfB family radical SAM enzyme